MTDKLTLLTVSSLENETTALSKMNVNSARTVTAMNNTLSRDGTLPNNMESELDMDSNKIINLPAATSDTEPVRKREFDDAVSSLVVGADIGAEILAQAQAAADEAESSADSSAAFAASASISSTAASGFATTAGTSAVSSANSATSASTSATNAATSATGASTSATAAAGSATSAATSATNASNSASSAASSATDSFNSATSSASFVGSYMGTSGSNIAIGTGSKSFTTQASKHFDTGTFLLITSRLNPATNWMAGQSTGYSGTSLTFNATSFGGSGSHSDWDINLSGAPGAAGAPGAGSGTVLQVDGNNGLTGSVTTTGNIGLASPATTPGHFYVTGNLGVGTASPSAQIHATNSVKVGTGVASNTSKLMVNTPSGTGAGIQLFQDSNESWIIQNPASTSNLNFYASGVERMRLTTGGNLGIGTTNVVSPLTVEGSAGFYIGNIKSTASTGSSYGLLVDGGTNSSDYNSRLRSKVGTDYLAVRGDGNVGIGTASPTTQLHTTGTVRHAGLTQKGPVYADSSGNLSSYGGYLIAAEFGVVGDTAGWNVGETPIKEGVIPATPSTNDQPALQNFFNACASQNRPGLLIGTVGTKFRVDAPLTLPSYVRIEGVNPYTTIIYPNHTGDAIIAPSASTVRAFAWILKNFGIYFPRFDPTSNVNLYGSGLGYCLNMKNITHAHIENMRFLYGQIGTYLDLDCYYNQFINCTFDTNQFGTYLAHTPVKGSNSNNFIGCHFKGIGFHTASPGNIICYGAVDYGNQNVWTGCTFEADEITTVGGTGILMQSDSLSGSVNSCRFEAVGRSTGTYGINLNGCSDPALSGNYFTNVPNRVRDGHIGNYFLFGQG